MATLVMICGTVYYSSILGEVAANIQTDDMQRGHYKGRLSDIIKFFKVYHVDGEIRKQVSVFECPFFIQDHRVPFWITSSCLVSKVTVSHHSLFIVCVCAVYSLLCYFD